METQRGENPFYPEGHNHIMTPNNECIRGLIRYMGEDPDREGLKDTPRRYLQALQEMTQGCREDPNEILGSTFEEVTSDDVVLLKGVKFSSLCEHHIMPFFGEATVGYLPQHDKVVGVSKLARLVQCFARRLQIQERMTRQIAESIIEALDPLGVGVVIRAHHTCMGSRGVLQRDAQMVTSAIHGLFRVDPALRAEVMSL